MSAHKEECALIKIYTKSSARAACDEIKIKIKLNGTGLCIAVDSCEVQESKPTGHKQHSMNGLLGPTTPLGLSIFNLSGRQMELRG